MAHHHRYLPHPVTEPSGPRAVRALAGAGAGPAGKGRTS